MKPVSVPSVAPISLPPTPSAPPSGFAHITSSSTNAAPHRIGSPATTLSSLHTQTPSSLSTPSLSTPSIDPFFGRVLSSTESGYVRDFSSWSVARLEKEPRVLAAQEEKLQREIEDLSLKNYPTFLDTNRVLKSADEGLQQIDTALSELTTRILPELSTSCEKFSRNTSQQFLQQVAQQRNMVSHQNFLLELLEIPNLMDTCFKNNLIHEALQLDLYMKELIDSQMKHMKNQQQQQQMAAAAAGGSAAAAADASGVNGGVIALPSILVSIQAEMSDIKRNIVNNLLTQLRGNMNVETGFPIVGLLKRTLDIFNPSTATGNLKTNQHEQNLCLKFQFLLSRNAYFEQALKGLQVPALPANLGSFAGATSPTNNAASPSNAAAGANANSTAVYSMLNSAIFKYLDEYLYLNRTNLFDIITLYSALFLDHDEGGIAGNADVGAEATTTPVTPGSVTGELDEATRNQREDLALLCRWIHRRMEILIATLNTYLPYLSDGSSFFDLLSSSMEYGFRLSRSKLALDFRPLLSTAFCSSIRTVFERNILTRAIGAFQTNLTEYALYIPPQNLQRLGITLLDQPAANQHLVQYLSPLLSFPALAMLTDGFIAASNELSKCAPIALCADVSSILERAVENAIQKMKNMAQTSSAHSSSHHGTTTSSSNAAASGGPVDEHSASLAALKEDPVLLMAHAFHDSFLPLVAALLARIYPDLSPELFPLRKLQSSLSVFFEEEQKEIARVESERKRQAELAKQRAAEEERERVKREAARLEEEKLAQARALELMNGSPTTNDAAEAVQSEISTSAAAAAATESAENELDIDALVNSATAPPPSED